QASVHPFLGRHHDLQRLAALEQLVAPHPIVELHAMRDDRVRLSRAIRHHGHRSVPTTDDVGGTAELEVDRLHERGVEGEHELLVAVHADHADPPTGAGDVDAIQKRGHESDALEHSVRTAAAGAILNEARDVDLTGVHGYGTEALCHLEAARHRVDGVDRRRRVAPRAEDRHKADRPAADDGDHVTFFYACLARAVVPRGEAVAHEQGLLIADRVIDAVEHEIGVRDTHVLRLSAGDVA